MVTENELNFDTGTTGQILTSNGAGVAPSFQTYQPGALKLIQTQNPNAAGTVEFKTGISSTYSTYLFVWNCASANAYRSLTVSSDGGSTYSITNYLCGAVQFSHDSTTLTNTNSTIAMPVLIEGSGTLWCFGIAQAINPFFVGDFTINNGSSKAVRSLATGTNTAITTVNAFKFSGSSITGKISLYGLAQ